MQDCSIRTYNPYPKALVKHGFEPHTQARKNTSMPLTFLNNPTTIYQYRLKLKMS